MAKGSTSVGSYPGRRPRGPQLEVSGLESQSRLKQTPFHHPGGRGAGSYPGRLQGVWMGAGTRPGTPAPKSTCLPAAPGLWRAAGGGGDRLPGVEGLASPSAPPQPRGEGLHRRRLQGAAPASRQPPAQVPNPDP